MCDKAECWCHLLYNLMALVSSNVSLEPYDDLQSQKSYNNIRRILSMVYFHCKTIKKAQISLQIWRKAAEKSVILGRKNHEKVPQNHVETGN